MLVNRELILAKIESTYNVDSTPSAATDAILVENINWSQEGLRMVDRPSIQASLSTNQQIYAGSLRSVTFDVEIKGAGAAYSASVAPEVDVLLRACGMGVTLVTTVGSESITYEPVSTGHESITIYYYQDGMLYKLTGCRGNVSFDLSTGAYGKVSFTFVGHSSSPTDAALVTPTYDSTIPPPVIAGAFNVDSYAAVIAALGFDLGNTTATPDNFSAADGFGDVQITKRDVNGSFDPEAVTVATEAFEANLRSGLSMALTTGSIGSTQYNRYTVDMPAIYYRSLAPGDRDGIRTYSMGFGADESSGDDEVSIKFD